MALLTLSVFLSIRRNVLRFRALARDLRTGTAGYRSFVSQNEVSELTGVAEEFDRLVRDLRASDVSIRPASDDQAHAYTHPIAINRQPPEPPTERRASRGNARQTVESLEVAL